MFSPDFTFFPYIEQDNCQETEEKNCQENNTFGISWKKRKVIKWTGKVFHEMGMLNRTYH